MQVAPLTLDASARLRLNEGACLPLRSGFGGCRACASVCPAQVIRVQVEQVALADGCLHCGRCVAACPTDALQLEGFELAAELPRGIEPIEIECAKVPAAQRAPNSIEVPCLGALSVGRIAQLHEAAGQRGIALIDRGWCGQCTAGCGADSHPVAAAHERVVLWLDAIGDPRPAPRFIARTLPIESMPARIPVRERADEGPQMSRRQFFRSVAQDPVGSRRTAMGSSGRAAFPPSERREAPDRRRLLDALDKAALRAGTVLPAELFPRVTASGACADHRVCIAACPTGALKIFDTGGEVTLTVAAATCIGCGACTRACPERALALDGHGGERAPAVIAKHMQRTCTTCGEEFTPRADEATCLACSKTQRFIGDAMAQFFGARH